MKRFIGTRILVALLSVSLVVTMMPQIAFAAPKETEPAEPVQEEITALEEGEAAFSQTETIDGVRITVEAEQGVFPADAFLHVEKITKQEQKKVDAAVEEALDKDRNIGLNYSFDIKK